ncbi:hypothetical protein [Candidatus Magnetominusculus xianensis]|uniref:DUF1344 domain-containing protein n=1 Tax=Candidatus Magnetominusculus xianensis TaxID=1748249 RepID=A0ABR5SFJ1_9BACT|nr:hypothetical protein [Candidatus Magnetominusculus xianensis]KWT84033.1 hypothetical protein ASN18_1960 [Candidatus Magnetominusculus xianensis]MBF0402326.1 hypothetical protein [Nitrospirota bacterium]
MRRLVIAAIVALVIGISGVISAADGKYEVKPSATMKEILFERTGKRVMIKTDSGEALEGTLTTVGDQVAHLSKLTGKDYYDAVIRIDKITSVVFKP